MAYAAVAGQSGCATSIIVIGSFFLGLWIDSLLDTKPVFTIILVIISVPVSLYVMVRMVLGAISQITPPRISASKSNINDETE